MVAKTPKDVTKAGVERLRALGWTDQEIFDGLSWCRHDRTHNLFNSFTE